MRDFGWELAADSLFVSCRPCCQAAPATSLVCKKFKDSGDFQAGPLREQEVDVEEWKRSEEGGNAVEFE